MARPARTPVNASPASLQTPTHDSGPPGSLTLRCRTPPFLASCRFIPAHYVCPSSRFSPSSVTEFVTSECQKCDRDQPLIGGASTNAGPREKGLSQARGRESAEAQVA